MLLSLFRAHAVEGQGAQVKEYAADICELPVKDPLQSLSPSKRTLLDQRSPWIMNPLHQNSKGKFVLVAEYKTLKYLQIFNMLISCTIISSYKTKVVSLNVFPGTRALLHSPPEPLPVVCNARFDRTDQMPLTLALF